MKEEEKREDREPGPITESIRRAAAQANLQRALDAMAKLRLTIDRRPCGLTRPREHERLLIVIKTCLYEARLIAK